METISDSYEFHDAELTQILVDWPGRVATLYILTSLPEERRTIITASGLEQLTVPMYAPWGKSCSINSTRGEMFADHRLRKLEIEMQSGDVIHILAENIRSEIEEIKGAS